ncbi:uncharacterized protein MELLADRAFT_111554 [Melampsora larici-populina 98AG31]|uniref:Uncharacterized protein n=1 Tax=Melampsora larici-populina (strain 98AG31 / pathotype 3-4-7) TaxID=747676 RepID=F4S3K6_MELLP|nr:uncharacterized protein MELLADRAFT_111554 [Melampsora larici-populina 98AG31]EGG00775.1 hypothetical protein MELLADRAFT_111554 [Melampsora larici-populina 98AG31]
MTSQNAQPVATESLAPITSRSGTIARNGTENEAGGSDLVTPRRSGRQIPNRKGAQNELSHSPPHVRRKLHDGHRAGHPRPSSTSRPPHVEKQCIKASEPAERQHDKGQGELEADHAPKWNSTTCYETPIVHILPLPEEETEVLEIIIEDSPGKLSSPLPRS